MELSQFNEEDDIEENISWGGLDATVFLIDADSKPGDNNYSLANKCIQCVYHTLCQKIRNRDNGPCAVVFYNTKEKNNSFDFPHIFNLLNLDISCAERILELEDLMDNIDNFESKIGSDPHASLHDVFWVCRNIFNSFKKKIGTKNIFLFTANDHPHFSDDHKIRQAFKGAKDLFEANIHVEVLPLAVSFDDSKFYKELLAEWEEGDTIKKMAKISNPADSLEELLDRVTRLEHKQRTTARISFTLAPGSELGVKLYTYIMKQYLPANIKLYKVANEEVIRQKKETLENGEILLSSDFIKYQIYGNKRIKFALDEIRHVFSTHQTGIKLIGFKPLSFFKPFYYIKPANVIYPDEASIKGSTKLFACLHERCLRKNVCPIVQIQARENSSISCAFLLPQKEEVSESNQQIHAPVFFVCYLPFSDDFRNVEVEGKARAENRIVEVAKDIIRTYTSNFDAKNYENPVIQTHWSIIEAYALNRVMLREVRDSTKPDNDDIEDKAGDLIEYFKSLVFDPDYDPLKTIKKRPAQDPNFTNKRIKTDESSVEILAKDNKVDKLNMTSLKTWLHAKGIKTTGKKKHQLVQDVYEQLGL